MNVRFHFDFFLKTVVLWGVVIEGDIHGVLVNKRACTGGPAHFNATGGAITSPLLPHGPPTQVSCTWVLHNPKRDTLILSFSKFDLDEDTKCGKRSFECCPHQWLMVRTELPSPERSRRDILQDDKRHKSDSGRGDHDREKQQAMTLKRKWLSLFHGPFLNGTFGDFLTSKSSSRHSQETFDGDDSPPHIVITSGSSSPKKSKSPRKRCGKTPPLPIITTNPQVAIKFYSDKRVEPGHLGFTIEYQISNNMTVCSSEEFMCSEPQLCIPKSWQCNGQIECPDSTDEADCQAGCAGLDASERCDGRWHCENGEDELGCFGCEADEWWCGEDTDCYKSARRCDGIPDCRNRADEVYCNCFNQTRYGPNSEFCYDAKTQRCDGILHCPNGNDEMDCGGRCRHMIQCGHGDVCYTSAQRCDGVSQCADGSDEASCTPQLCHPQHGAFLCANHRCIRDTWRCDQFDDCGDASDEEDCLRNSVIVAAAMGGLVCSLLLVIAVGCTCRLYALRIGLTRYRQQGYRGGRRSTPLAPLSRLEQHLLQREPPPSYSVAVNDPSAALFGSRRLSRQWRRQRRRPPAPPEGVLPPLPVPMRGHASPGPLHTYDTGPGHASNLLSVTGGNSGCRSSDEKENEEEAKAITPTPVPHASAHHSLPRDEADDDVPLLSAVDGGMEDRDDATLLEVILTSEDSADESMIEDDALLLDVTVGSEASDSDLEGRTDIAENPERLSHTAGMNAENEAGQSFPMNACENGGARSGSFAVESPSSSIGEAAECDELGNRNAEEEGDLCAFDSASLLGDVMTDTRAAVLALTVVQKHMDDAHQVDTEFLTE
ncbi:low-density lipoprotein receptor-related protein 3-like [Palaemon carinicauda]|uniref:low-density lipoprotein receptor-related protein 3-like n=1 Tax=Palaemon carinicauda TaxID=392227 RepID=UPI0035B66D3A